jgi:hypothetical protein
MNDALVPNWIKEMESEAELAKAQSEAAAQRQIAATLTVEAEGPEFWRQLHKELAINADALPKIGIRGTTSAFSYAQGAEQHLRIDVALAGLFPNMTYTDLFYMPGSTEIRCHTLEGEVFSFAFCVLPNNKGIGVIPENHMTPINAEKMAEMIVKRMVNRVRKAS